jgi:RNA polymerase sigma factor (sigma-70 family)
MITTTSSLQLRDIQSLKNPQMIADLFSTLGYHTACCAPLNTYDLELSPNQTQWLNQAYLIANQNNISLQIILFEFENSAENQLIQIMQKIAKSLTQRPANYLLLSTIQYDRILLTKPQKTFNQKLELVTTTTHSFIQIKNPGFNDLNLIQKLAISNLSSTQIQQKQQEIISYEHEKQKEEEKKEKPSLKYDPVNLYLKQIGRIPLLTAAEEIQLALKISNLLTLQEIHQTLKQKLTRNPSKIEWATAANLTVTSLETQLKIGGKAKNKLIEANLRLVVSIAKRYKCYGLEFLDLIQEGNLGLIRAVEKFDHTKGYKFSTYATWWIRQRITRAIADQSRIIRLPVHINEKISKIKTTARNLSQRQKRLPTKLEIANNLNINIEELNDIIKLKDEPFSLESTFNNSEDIPLISAISSQEKTPQQLSLEQNRQEILQKAFKELKPKYVEMMILRFGLTDGIERTLADVGRIFNLSRERIRQIEAKFLKKLKTQHSYLREYL